MTNKEYLQQYRHATLAARQIEQEIEELRASVGVQGLKLDDMPKGTNQSDLSGYAVKLDALERKLEKQLIKRLKLREEITRRIERQENEMDRVILRMRYISFLKWEEIAEELAYSERRVYQMHGAALQRFR